MNRRALLTILVPAVIALVGLAPVAGLTASGAPKPAVAMLPYAGDVFTTAQNGSLIAVDPASTPPWAPLYSLEGNPLNLIWGQWMTTTATAVAQTERDDTNIEITMSGLIPNGVYSLFYRTFGPDSVNPICGAIDPVVALTARFPDRQLPDPYSVVADSSGAAFFHARVGGRLLDAQALLIDVIYHFDGNVYGAVPTLGESESCRPTFGIDAMRQLVIFQTFGNP
jgi:hypothetical protein